MKLSQVGILPYPSTTDFAASIPNKVIEYFSGGLPVLSSVQGIVRDMLDSEGAGLTYANNSPTSLAEAICKYLADPNLRKLHAANAARLFERKFSADRVYSSMADHVEGIILATIPAITT
jgi:glycosyltransferase involved in cell wall biosynthesis